MRADRKAPHLRIAAWTCALALLVQMAPAAVACACPAMSSASNSGESAPGCCDATPDPASSHCQSNPAEDIAVWEASCCSTANTVTATTPSLPPAGAKPWTVVKPWTNLVTDPTPSHAQVAIAATSQQRAPDVLPETGQYLLNACLLN